MKISCSISIGELLDKVSILQIKKEKISNPEKQVHLTKELEELMTLSDSLAADHQEWIKKLYLVNLNLWEIEDLIRIKEKKKEFDDEFIELARSVYETNDMRFQIKNSVNDIFDSDIKEQKSYEEYTLR